VTSALDSGAFLAPAEDLVEQFGVTLEIVQDFGWSEGGFDILNQPGLVRRRVDPVRNAIHAANHFLAALGKHERDEQAPPWDGAP
jgi:hypothetical protein